MTIGGFARCAAIFTIVLAVASRTAFADQRVAQLSELLSSSNERTRLAAVVALAKIGDKPTLKPLVGALDDPSAKVRLVAAVALGRLGHKAALPALRHVASDDADPDVRAKARAAAIAIAKTNALPHPFAERTAATATAPPRRRPRAGFGNHPHALGPRPDLYVVIKSSSDDSPGRADKAARKEHAEIIRSALATECKSAANVTSVASEAARYGLALRNIDLSVVKLAVTRVGRFVEIEAQLRLAISDGRGKMLSFLSGGAKVQVRADKFNPRYLPNLRREALENAMRGMFGKLVEHLRTQPRA